MKGALGVSFNDRELASKVRTMTLNECMRHLQSKKGKLYEMVLSNLSRTVLPRLAELTGEGGGALNITISESIANKNGINSGTGSNSG